MTKESTMIDLDVEVEGELFLFSRCGQIQDISVVMRRRMLGNSLDDLFLLIVLRSEECV